MGARGALAAGAKVPADELTFASAIEAARAIRAGSISSLELTQHVLERVEKFNPRINAIVTLLGDEALARARSADDALARGENWGPLHGVPITIKDTFEIKGIRTTAGSPALSDYKPKTDAPTVTRLRNSGAIFIGKTNVPLFAADMQTFNEVFGTTNNPWDEKLTTGGSTGGGAAALATGLGYLTLGSDIGGSIRNPSSFCGVYGHKPTHGLIPERGELGAPPQELPVPNGYLSVAGPLARNAADLKLALEILGGPDAEDAIAYRWQLPPARGSRLTDYRIGYILDDPFCPIVPEVKKVLTDTVEAMKKAGVKMEEGWPEGVDPKTQFDTYLYLLLNALAEPLTEAESAIMRKMGASKENNVLSIRGRAFTDPGIRIQKALAEQLGARAIWQNYFRTHDAFLLPTAYVPAFPHDHSTPIETRVIQTSLGPRPYIHLLNWISFATLTGIPATTAPVGKTDKGLPVGIQILGPYLEDATPIDIAGKLADLTGGFVPPKGYV